MYKQKGIEEFKETNPDVELQEKVSKKKATKPSSG